MKRRAYSFLLLAAGFFALYALTAQRGLGWGDSGEFQYRILSAVGATSGCDSFATAHPLYTAFAGMFCSTPFHVTLVSSLFGAVAAAGLYLLSGDVRMSALFALSHAAWWLSCVAEVYTMSLAFFAAELLALAKFRETGKVRFAVLLAFVNGLHLELHNVALLSLPVYAFAVLPPLLRTGTRRALAAIVSSAAAWCLAAAFWLYALFANGPADVLFGSYGSQVAGLLPARWSVAAFNWCLAGMSFFVPAALWFWNRRRPGPRPDAVLLALLAIHFGFWVRYFIVSQFTFVLPSLFLAYLIAAKSFPPGRRFVPLAAIQLVLPLAAFFVLREVGFPSWYWRHPHRDNAAYFALPWKFNDDSADKCAAEMGGEWKGYCQ